MIGRTVAHYQIVEKIGQGGMGVVYRADDLNLRRTVAIKFLRPDMVSGDMQRQRFKKEAQAAASLNHPNIATIHDYIELDSEVFFIMEYVNGQDLRDILQTCQVLSLDHIMKYSIQIASGLKAAHQKNIVHRDIKPENIRITPDDQVKIMDFGIVKLPGNTRLTQEGSSIGTISYMSPEQTRGQTVDKRTDIWSFGAMLYEMLTGEEPFKGHYNEAVLYSILNEDPEPIEKLRENVPEFLHAIVKKSLQKNPDNRYQSVDEIIADLEKKPVDTAPAIHPDDNAAGQAKTEHGQQNFLQKYKKQIFFALLFLIILTVFSIGQYYPAGESPGHTTSPPAKSAAEIRGHPQFIRELLLVTDTPSFMNKLNELRKSMRIAVGNREDFSSPEGCFIFVLGVNRVEAVFQFQKNRFINIDTGEILESLAFAYSGKSSVWVRDLSH